MNNLLIEKILRDFPPQQASEITAFLDPVEKNFKKNEIIYRYSKDSQSIAILLEGTAAVCSINSDGQKNILAVCLEGDCFGSKIFPYTGQGAVFAAAKESCKISYINHKKFEECCRLYSSLYQKIICPALEKLMIHLDILSQRTIKDKLLCSFYHISQTKNSCEFTLPISLTDLADFLCCDRSAMLRELKNLNDRHILSSCGRKITLLAPQINY